MMKKLLSLLIAVAMLMSVSVSMATSVVASGDPQMKVEMVNLSSTGLEVGTTFDLNVYYSGVPCSENDDNWAGTGIGLVQFELDLPGWGDVITNNGKTYNIDTLGSSSGTNATKNITNETLKYAWVVAATAEGLYRAENQIVCTLKLKVVKEISSPIEFKLHDCIIRTFDVNDSDVVVGSSKTDYEDAVLALNSVKIGEANPKVTSVTVSPATVNVVGGDTQAFTANVVGENNPAQDVTWTASEGSIDATGLFTAPDATSIEQTITITATSVTDNTKSGTATVTVPAKGNEKPSLKVTGAKGAIAGSFYYDIAINANGAALHPFGMSITGDRNGSAATKDLIIGFGSNEIKGELNFKIGISGATSGETYSASATASNAVGSTTDTASAAAN